MAKLSSAGLRTSANNARSLTHCRRAPLSQSDRPRRDGRSTSCRCCARRRALSLCHRPELYRLPEQRRIPFQDHLGALIGIDIAQWWRPTAANFFDRVPKQVILEALGEVGGAELAARYASVKKADLAASAERIFAGTTIAEVAERERALAWVPDVMRFGAAHADDGAVIDAEPADGEQVDCAGDADDGTQVDASPRDLAA
jgi:hypothetical protein